MLDFTPDPIAIHLGPLPVYWYGIGYALGLAVAYLVMVRLARRAGEDADILGNGIIVVAIAALIGGRLYHVIDQWVLYQDDPIKIILPPYSGLGVYGGIATGTIAAFLYARYKRAPFLRWTDIIAPGLFVMQAIARWGNFFNQELYGSPTTLPWGIPIDCAHRISGATFDYTCAVLPETTRFHPLFLYESLSGALGAIVLIWLGFHARKRLRPGDLLLIFFVWYGLVRFVLETLREGNWTFNGVPVAQIVSLLFVIPALVILAWRHRPGHPTDDPPSHPEAATWGAIGRPVEPTLEGEDDDEPDDESDASDEAEPEVAADLEADETSEPDAEPAGEPDPEPEAEAAAESEAASTDEPEAESPGEPEAEPAAQPEAEPAAEPEADPATDQ
jgi:phosphatidylglycerol:prolipoprotein diacylglycerol transferase